MERLRTFVQFRVGGGNAACRSGGGARPSTASQLAPVDDGSDDDLHALVRGDQEQRHRCGRQRSEPEDRGKDRTTAARSETADSAFRSRARRAPLKTRAGATAPPEVIEIHDDDDDEARRLLKRPRRPPPLPTTRRPAPAVASTLYRDPVPETPAPSNLSALSTRSHRRSAVVDHDGPSPGAPTRPSGATAMLAARSARAAARLRRRRASSSERRGYGAATRSLPSRTAAM